MIDLKPANAVAQSMVRTKGTVIDVVGNYNWTLSPMKGELNTLIPRILLREYQQTTSSLTQATSYFTTNVNSVITQAHGQAEAHYSGSNQTDDVAYNGLYDPVYNPATGFVYIFPYFSENYFNVQSSWTSFDGIEKLGSAIREVGKSLGAGDIVNPIMNMAEGSIGVAEFAAGAIYPKSGFIDKPYIWSEISKESITISFYLFNTIDISGDEIAKNWQLCNQLTYQNLYAKVSFVTAYPPVFYSVHIENQYHSKASYVSNLKISNVGNIRRMNLNGNNSDFYNIPDAYLINMTLTEMLMPSRNLLNLIYGGLDSQQIITSTLATKSP